MKILICGGDSEADYVIKSFKKDKDKIVVFNDDAKVAKRLSETNDIDVLLSDPTKIYSFESGDVFGFDLVISLMPRDVDNFVVCQIAKTLFHIKKAICTVNNPNNVAIFEELGIDSPISASFLLTERIKGESDIESLIKTLSLENQKIVITEIKIKSRFFCSGKAIKDLNFPRVGNICCIFRDPKVIIPRGDTTLMEGDTLVIASGSKDQNEVIAFVKRVDDGN